MVESESEVMATELQNALKSVWQTLVFWNVSVLLVLQAERLFLLPEVTAAEPPTASIIKTTFLVGVYNDVIVMLGAVALTVVLAGIATGLLAMYRPFRTVLAFCEAYRRCLLLLCLFLVIVLVAIVSVDIGYYAFNQQHLNFVFFEYVGDMISGMGEGGTSQASEQTGAELDEIGTYLLRTAKFLGLVALFIAVWKVMHRRIMQRSGDARSYPANGAVGLLLLFGTMSGVTAGYAEYDGRSAPLNESGQVQSNAYYVLAQNPILFSVKPVTEVFLAQWTPSFSALPYSMRVAEAIEHTQLILGRGDWFPDSEYPLVREHITSESPYFGRRVNVLVLFVEGLDRRFIDRVQPVQGLPYSGATSAGVQTSIRLTPFLDNLKNDSLYFSHFFSNGVQTARGLFSTLCSTFPRQGASAIKTRYTYDYQCLPSVLRQAGYRTEMVVSSRTNLPGLREFVTKNGIENYYGNEEFPEHAERLGIGLTDGALFDFLETRLAALESTGRPFFLTALTTGTHHPFVVPNDHIDVQALQQGADPYMAALRYFDLAFEQFFNRICSKGLLENTLVVILGDHGRHESIGHTDAEREVGHFLAPMLLWVDDSLRAEERFHPRVVSQVASQVDIAPTVLGINGITPHLTSSVGTNLTCLMKIECLNDNQAYLSSVYDDLIGLSDQSGIWLYSFRRGQRMVTDLDLQLPFTIPAPQEPATKEHVRTMTALYVSSNMLLDRNRIWRNLAPQ
jgi:phosphoglycerol transferase MdoB-like AlkP superfamily enzyme